MADTTFVNGITLTDAGWFNDVNDLFYTYLGGQSGGAPGTCAFDLKFTDATYDIGKSGATRPRDIFASRGLTLAGGSQLQNYTTWATYTPTVTLVGGAGNTVPVYSTNTGRWMQIGKMVFVTVLLSGDGGAEGAGTGVFTVALPVAVGASYPTEIDYPIGRAFNSTSRWIVIGRLAPAATTMTLLIWLSTTSQPGLLGDDQNNATRGLSLSFSYEVA